MKFGELESVRLLGKGGMSEVWEAANARLGSRSAVKVYAYPKESEEVRARFEQEGRMLAAMRHPRIVGVSDIGRMEDGRPYFVMDLILNPDGKPQTLAEVSEGGADEETVARWYDDIREGLAAIHARGIVHRDLKLQNVMVGPDGHAVLTDFGIARVLDAKEGPAVVDPVNTIIEIRDGKKPVMGSLGYLAPELSMGCAATPASDWYALGVLVYRLLTGTWCDARTDVASTLDSYDPAWLQIVPKLLHANPAGRECPSFAETKRALTEAEAAAAEERYLKEKRRGHVARHAARWIAGVAGLLAVALLVGAFQFRSNRQSELLSLQRDRLRLLKDRLSFQEDSRQLQEDQRRLESERRHLPQNGAQANVPTFDELFSIPAAARADETTDAKGNVTMPSRSAFEASRVDALVLTHPVLSSLEAGSITLEKAISAFETMAAGLEEDADRSPLDNLEFGGNAYMQMGENEALRRLLLQGVERLRARSEAE